MAAKLHALLAAERTVTEAAAKIFTETEAKMGKVATFFEGHTKNLRLIEDSPSKDAQEKAGTEVKALASTIPETLAYMLNYWGKAEDLLFQKNRTNQTAKANIEFNGVTIVSDVPVDELLGLEARLPKLRELIAKLPTLDASKEWDAKPDVRKNMWQTRNLEVTTKTEKVFIPIVLAAATDKHPAQVKESTSDKVVGSFELSRQSGAITSRAKADALNAIDSLIAEVKKARARANEVEVVSGNIADALLKVVFEPILNQKV
jgi:hypothetical protein